MSDLTERVARAIDAAAQPRTYRNGDMARAAIRDVLAAMREPSATMRLAGDLEADGQRHGSAVDVTGIWREMLRAFEHEHGIEPPAAEEQRP